MTPNANLCDDLKELEKIRRTVGQTRDGKSYDWVVKEKVEKGLWRLECIKPEVVGLERPIELYRAVRKPPLIKPWPRSDESYCPAHWADLAIGEGACGLGCRTCFLVLTHRIFCDPSRHVLYENIEDYLKAVIKWLKKPRRRNLGVGTDCSDSLLYEGVTGIVRRLIPIFNDPAKNPSGSKLILLTKSTNVHYLQGLSPLNVILSFSLNPESIADLWEGKWDDGVRITPSIDKRLEASLKGQEMGFEIRWRVDPILYPSGYESAYEQFFNDAARAGHKPTRITLGTYREMQRSLSTIAKGWGLGEMEWTPPKMLRDGSHYHIPASLRIRIYGTIIRSISEAWRGTGNQPIIALCKETAPVRQALGLNHDMCNCG